MALGTTAEQVAQHGLDELLRKRLVREVKVATPAAGAQWQQAVPGGSIWELLSVQMFLTTSAVAGNRSGSIVLADADGVVIGRYTDNKNTPAGTNDLITLASGLGLSANTSGAQSGLPSPPVILPSGFTITSVSPNFDVADTWTAITLMVRTWSETSVVQNATLIGNNYDSLTIDK